MTGGTCVFRPTSKLLGITLAHRRHHAVRSVVEEYITHMIDANTDRPPPTGAPPTFPASLSTIDDPVLQSPQCELAWHRLFSSLERGRHVPTKLCPRIRHVPCSCPHPVLLPALCLYAKSYMTFRCSCPGTSMHVVFSFFFLESPERDSCEEPSASTSLHQLPH